MKLTKEEESKVSPITRIELARRRQGKSQFKLATEIEMHPSVITQVERGYRKPWPKLRQRLSEALGVEESTLFFEDGTPRPA